MGAQELLSFFSNWSVILPLFLGIIFINRLAYSSKIILAIVVFATIPQLMNAFNIKNDVVKNLTYNIYTPLEFLLFYFLFDKYIKGEKGQKALKASLFFYILASLFFILEDNLTSRFLDEWVCINNLIYTMWIMIVFYKQYSLSNTLRIDTTTSSFWILIGLLFYAPFCSLYFSVYHYAQQQNFSSLKSIHHIINTSMYIFFAIGIYKDSLSNYSKNSSTANKQAYKDVTSNKQL